MSSRSSNTSPCGANRAPAQGGTVVGGARLVEYTVGGLHDYLAETVLPRYVRPGGRAADLGAGSGALAVRLQGMGMEVVAVERDRQRFAAAAPLVQADLNAADFAAQLGWESFDLVTSVEVIEHLENPVSFLRNVALLLTPRGAGVITTPNVENVPARLRFLLSGRLRQMDERGDLTHITPVFTDLLFNRWLPRAGLEVVERRAYPPRGFLATRRRFAWAMSLLARVLPGTALDGDNHIFVLRRR